MFSIEAGNEATDLFHIDANTGMMSTVGKLDYESKRHHQLRVRATGIFCQEPTCISRNLKFPAKKKCISPLFEQKRDRTGRYEFLHQFFCSKTLKPGFCK